MRLITFRAELSFIRLRIEGLELSAEDKISENSASVLGSGQDENSWI